MLQTAFDLIDGKMKVLDIPYDLREVSHDSAGTIYDHWGQLLSRHDLEKRRARTVEGIIDHLRERHEDYDYKKSFTPA